MDMASTPVVQAVGLTKTYELFDGPLERLRCRLGMRAARTVAAVRDVSFQVEGGRAFGIMGQNGAGKSTLLRMLAGITRPTSGSYHVRGRIGSILELGNGFHPELTGRQNIRLSAALAGLEARDVGALSDAIIEFSELEGFIDEPLKRYSSGMVVRLAFAIASQSRPAVLIVDEALSVGDGAFQKKSLDRIRSFLKDGGAVVLSTHALYGLTSICDDAIWLHHGRVEAAGAAADVAARYRDHLRRAERPSPPRDERPDASASGPSIAAIDLVGGESHDGEPPLFHPGQPWSVRIEVVNSAPDLPLHLGVGVNTEEGREVFAFTTLRDKLPPLAGRDRHVARITVPELPLHSGQFDVHVYLLDEAGVHAYQHETLPGAFRIRTPVYSPALIDPPRTWDWPVES